MDQPESRLTPAVRDAIPATGGISIRHLMIICVVIGLLLPVLFLSGWAYATRETDIHERLKQLSAQYVDLIVPVLTQATWNVDEPAARRVVGTLSQHATIARIRIQNLDGRDWIDSRPAAKDSLSDLRVRRELKQEGQIIGWLVLDLSGEPIADEISANFYKLLALVFFQAIIAITPVLWIMKQRVLKPLEKLGHEAVRIAQRDLEAPITSFGDDEIGALAGQLEQARRHLVEAFNSLAQSQRTLENELYERRKAQQALQHMAGQLEVRVAERTRELSDVNAQLSQTVTQLNTAKDEIVRSEKLAALGSLVAGIAHELNTPIGNGLLASTSVIDMIERFNSQIKEGAIRRTDLTDFVANIAKGCEIIKLSMERSADLVSSFKQVAVDQTSSKRRRFSLNSVIHEIMLLMRPSFKGTPYTVSTDTDANIFLDSYPGELGQVLMNLFKNTLLHAFEGRDSGHIHIHAALTENEQVRISFSDDGIGIAPEHLQRIYEPFFTTKMGRGGTGLGMHLVYNLVSHILGGSLHIESQPGQGTTVIMTLPLRAPEQAGGQVTG